MPNKIPTAIRRHVNERSNRQCELCGAIVLDGMHHIIPRRKKIHRVETLINLCGREHNDTLIEKMLQIALQDFYYDLGFVTDEIRKLMGGMLYVWEVDPKKAIVNHFYKLHDLYGDEFEENLREVLYAQQKL